MSYLVIARKYRPQSFADLVGQEHVSITLKNQIKSSRQAQAYLFTGPRGVGKTSAARLLAKALRCLDLTPDFEPCNKCAACVGVNNGSSMDVLEIDAASNTGVDNVRDLRENVNYMAAVGKYRVYIIDEVHMLSTAAFNALLKTVEEPPPHVIFIFATTELHKVPATIQSRCQRFDFKKIPPQVMMANLRAICDAEKITFEDAALAVITTESEGCLRDAQSLLDQALAFCGPELSVAKLETALGLLDRASLFGLMGCLGEHDPGQALKLASSILDKGTDPKILLSRIVDFLCDLHFRAFTGETRVPDPDQDALFAELSKKLSQDEIVRSMDLALRTQASLHSNINAAISVESLVVKLCLQRPAFAVSTQATANTQATTSSAPKKFAARATPAPSEPVPAEPTPQASAPIADGDRVDPGIFETFIRTNKPAWTPVLQSLGTLEMRNGALFVKAKGDFAGKRLASADGIALLKQAYKIEKAVVDLEAVQKKTEVAPADKRTLAREHDAVKAVLKVFPAATVTETKILEDERPSRRGKE